MEKKKITMKRRLGTARGVPDSGTRNKKNVSCFGHKKHGEAEEKVKKRKECRLG